MHRTSLRRLQASIPLTLLCACADATGPPRVLVEVVDGDGQLGLPGWALDRSVSVVVRDDGGAPVESVWVEFTVTAGGGAVTSDVEYTGADGVVTTRWVLGGTGPQRLTADVASRYYDAVPAALEAGFLPPHEADLIVVHGALGLVRGAMLSAENGSFGDPVWGPAVDTLIPVPPRGESGVAVAVFAQGNRPHIAGPVWTAGPDTVHVTLDPPVPIDLWLDVRESPYDDVVRRLETALDTVESIWAASAMGVTIGSVTFSDRSDLRPAHMTEPCNDRLAVPPGLLRASVVASIGYDGVAQGIACPPEVAFITGTGLAHPGAVLIAHELGHLFSLLHVSDGVMAIGSAISGRLHDGEAFIAHFDDDSALNIMYSSQPQAHRRPCQFAGACPEPLLDLRWP